MITLNTAVPTLQPEISGKRRPLLSPIPNSPGEFLMVIDNSSLEKFTTCPRSSEFYLVHNREAHAKNSALVFGGAIHLGLEAFELNLSPDEQDRRIVQYMTDHPVPVGEYRTIPVALQVMKAYRKRVEFFPDMQWDGLADSSGKQLIERAFEIPLTVVQVGDFIQMPWLTEEEREGQEWLLDGGVMVKHIHIAWSGRIDRVAHCTGRNRVCDHKTTSIGGEQITSEYHLSNPMLGYTWASRKLWPELDILGACMNFIWLKKPGVNGYPADLGAPGPRGGPPPLDFFRSYYDYTPERIDWWEKNVIEICSDFIANLVRGYFPSHTKSCIGKYGKCQYWGICTMDNLEHQLAMLNSPMFSDVTWNPVADR